MKTSACSALIISLVLVSMLSAAQNNFMNFDGANDYFEVSKPLPAMDECTMEAWLYRSSNTNWDVVLNYITWGTLGDVHFQFYPGANYIGFSVFGNRPTDVLTPFPAPLNTWHHVAMVYSSVANTIKIYIDGELENEVNYTVARSTSSVKPFTIGAWRSGSIFRPMNGNIDELRIWNYARSKDEINNFKDVELVGVESGLVAYYNFNEGTCGGANGSVSTLLDLTGNSHNGVPTNFAQSGCSSNWVCGGLAPCGIADNGVKPRVKNIPTISEWGLIFLFLGFLAVGSAWMYRSKEKEAIA